MRYGARNYKQKKTTNLISMRMKKILNNLLLILKSGGIHGHKFAFLNEHIFGNHFSSHTS